jgi:hypothetical protein
VEDIPKRFRFENRSRFVREVTGACHLFT